MKTHNTTKVWTIEVLLEEDDETEAKALLRAGDRELPDVDVATDLYDLNRPVAAELSTAQHDSGLPATT